MPAHLRPATATNTRPPVPPITLERDATNFDFRVVMLLLVLITRPDLLKEYLDDGKEKDACNVPVALHDPTKWKILRRLFDPAMLAEMFYLFDRPQTQECAQYFLTVLRTMTGLEEYSFDGCPNMDFITAMVNYSHQQTAQLDAAGVAADPSMEN